MARTINVVVGPSPAWSWGLSAAVSPTVAVASSIAEDAPPGSIVAGKHRTSVAPPLARPRRARTSVQAVARCPTGAARRWTAERVRLRKPAEAAARRTIAGARPPTVARPEPSAERRPMAVGARSNVAPVPRARRAQATSASAPTGGSSAAPVAFPTAPAAKTPIATD